MSAEERAGKQARNAIVLAFGGSLTRSRDFLDAEELTRATTHPGRRPLYSAGRMIAIGTISCEHYGPYDTDGLIAAIAAAYEDSAVTSLLCVVQAAAEKQQSRLVCSFENGTFVSCEETILRVNRGYVKTPDSGTQENVPQK